jgi:molybdopterin-binding protein
MRISARNQLSGTVTEVVMGGATAHVQIDIGGAVITASLTREAVEELKLAPGRPAVALIKASDVLVAVDG